MSGALMSLEEKRKHARLEVDLPCSFAAGEASGEGRVADLSLAGARLLAPAGAAAVGEPLSLLIELPEPEPPLGLHGEVTRVEMHGDEATYGLHFAELPPDSREQLLGLLRKLAAARGGGERLHPRVPHRLDLRCRGQAEFRATLSNISRGGLALMSQARLTVGDRVAASLSTEQHSRVLEVSGVVAHVEDAGGGLYRAGIRFEVLGEEEERRLAVLIDVLLGLPPR